MLTISADQFLLDDKPFRILSGAIHYFRVVPEYWRDRLEKARAFGLNTIETYVAWNLHEPRPGEFRFDGGLDLVRFIQTAADLGLKVIVRPGPYICSEWDFGGLPAWLLKDPSLQVRCMYPPYLEAMDRFLDALLPRLVRLQISHGGPIIAMQVENEYGGFGNDRAYLEYLANGLRRRGVDALLFTSDGPRDKDQQGGSLPGVYKTVNFAYGAGQALEKQRQYQPEGPRMATEFWTGWFDHWGDRHHHSAGHLPIQAVHWTYRSILSAGASVNLYMFHGGTSFGFMNGANTEDGRYQADVSSYDYGAPLDEAGDLTPKFHALRKVLRSQVPNLPEFPLPKPSRKAAYGRVQLDRSASLFGSLDSLSHRQVRPAPEPMEAFDQDYGFILYRTQVSGPRPRARLEIHDLHDRAQVFLDGHPAGVLEREFPGRTLYLSIPAQGARLDILVENMGRVNFGPDLMDRKGITRGVSLGGQLLFGWEIFPLPLDTLEAIQFTTVESTVGPAFFRGSFQVEDPADTFLALPGWTKGVAWLNGVNLGRFWRRGPQHSLYVPAPLIRKGENELIVLELHSAGKPVVEFIDHPKLDR
ncbi:MAG TPA: beta-galactosidase family protein [Anaerolineales bacterium]|nr:beta-galactosidase family protein [Anaerolineales bacterium]